MKYRFRDKLLVAFALLLIVTLVPVLVLVNTQIESISTRKIRQDLQNTRSVFQRFQRNELAAYADRATVFIHTQSEIRAEIATSAERSEKLFAEPSPRDAFGAVSADAPDAPAAGRDAFGAVSADAPRSPPQNLPAGKKPQGTLPERQNLILSVVEDVRLYKESEIFFLADMQGGLIFSKAHPSLSDTDLNQLPEVVGAIQGKEIFTWWGSERGALATFGLLPDSGNEARLYQTFLIPLVFGREVRGLIGIGFGMTSAQLKEIIGITQSEIAFIADGRVYLNSMAELPAESLLRLTRSASPDDEIQRFEVADEEFLALVVPIKSTLGTRVGSAVVYRSMTKEMLVYDRLRQILNIIGAAALAVAGLLALLISRNVTHSLSALHEGVGQVREGNLDYKLELNSRDEFGEVGRAFNEMTAGLKEKEAIRDTFKRYVSSSVVDELLKNMDDIQLGGENKTLTVQFSDIAGFTDISEALTPEGVVEFLNEYLTDMTTVIEEQSGIVDKYIGDAVMAFWGTPQPLENHALNACRAAIGQIGKVNALRKHWSGTRNLSRFSIRIGLHTGEVTVGNIGSNTRMDYTIIGDAVNTASRLEGLNKLYGTHILISEDTYRLVAGQMVVRELDLVRPVGKLKPVRIYELIGESAAAKSGGLEKQDMKFRTFAQGLELYRAGNFKAALKPFDGLEKSMQDQASRLFAERCREYINNPPKGWDGVYVSTSK